MAESNSPRLGIRRWSDQTDTPSRVEVDGAFGQLELLVAIDKQDTFTNRPLPGVRGTYFWDTTNGLLWRDTGTAWSVVGSKVRDGLSEASAAGAVAFAVKGAAGQTANLFEVRDSADVVKASVNPGGSLTLASAVNAARLNAINPNTDPALAVITGKGAVGQIGDLLSLKNSGDTSMFKVEPNGAITSPFFQSASGRGIIGAGSSSNVFGMTKFSGTPVFEMYGQGGGAGTFTDFAYLKHQTADITAVLRRLGLLLKVGDEIAGDATKTGGIYIESSEASFTNPKLVLMRGDVEVMSFPAAGSAVITTPLQVTGGDINVGASGQFQAIRSTGTAHAYRSQVTGDVGFRLAVATDGKHEWGDGSATRDTNLYRSSPNVLKTDDTFDAGGGLRVGGVNYLEKVYPVGSIYLSTVSTNPNTLFGFGTWVEIQSQFLLGRSATYPAGSTGGAASKALVENELPSHSHSVGSIGTNSAGGHGHSLGVDNVTSSGTGKFAVNSPGTVDGDAGGVATGAVGGHGHTMFGSTAAAGGNASFSILPPYVAVYIWKRTL